MYIEDSFPNTSLRVHLSLWVDVETAEEVRKLFFFALSFSADIPNAYHSSSTKLIDSGLTAHSYLELVRIRERTMGSN